MMEARLAEANGGADSNASAMSITEDRATTEPLPSGSGDSDSQFDVLESLIEDIEGSALKPSESVGDLGMAADDELDFATLEAIFADAATQPMTPSCRKAFAEEPAAPLANIAIELNAAGRDGVEDIQLPGQEIPTFLEDGLEPLLEVGDDAFRRDIAELDASMYDGSWIDVANNSTETSTLPHI